MISKPADTPFETPRNATLWRGAYWKIGSMASFAVLNGIVRYCSGGAESSLSSFPIDPLPVNVMVFFQNLFGTICLLPWIMQNTMTKRDPLSPCGTRSVGPADKGSRVAGGEGTSSTVSPLIRGFAPPFVAKRRPRPARGEGKTLNLQSSGFFQTLLRLRMNAASHIHIFLNLLRVLTAVLGIMLWYLSLKYMPLAESVALGFTGPIFTVIGAWFLLQEKMDTRRFIAIVLSLVGAFIITRPDIPLQANTLGMAALLPLGSALALAFSKLLTRQLVLLSYTPSHLAASLMLWMTPVSLPLALLEWQWPTHQHWPWLMLMGALAACSHVTFGKAYQQADVTFLAPFGFSKFLFSASIGYFFFAELPTAWSLWLGMGVILSSVLVLSYKIPLYSRANRLRSS